MGIVDAVVVGLFCIAVVFVVLVMLWGAVAGFGWVIRRLETSLNQPAAGSGAGR
jgi:Na+-transporting methylmalonyl-CoA/oxaloacetate decarboxylase gamma subunit